MKKLVITLEITQSDVAAEYSVVDKELVFDDLKHGDLIEFCNIIDVAEVEYGNPYAKA